MGVQYDIECLDCGEGAGFRGSFPKHRAEKRAILDIRSTLERWADEGIDLEIGLGGSGGARPQWFAAHRGHWLRVMGDDGLDYTESDEGWALPADESM